VAPHVVAEQVQTDCMLASPLRYANRNTAHAALALRAPAPTTPMVIASGIVEQHAKRRSRQPKDRTQLVRPLASVAIDR
jgi:hypothetical protein